MKRDPVVFMERMLNSYHNVHTARYWNEVSPHIAQNAQGRILDIGCGPGLLLKDMISKFHANYAIGIDLSEIMIEKAKEINKSSLHEGKIRFILQHMQENPNLPDSLDLILSSRVMRSFENLTEVMDNIYHSLNIGGKFVLLDWAQASIRSYEHHFKQNRDNKITPQDIIRYHRNFSRYSLDDWDYIFNVSGLDVVHSFAVSEVLNCIIGEKI